MVFKYNKEYVKKNGRRLQGSSPRDLQRKQTQQSDVYEGLVEDLRQEINNLKKELQSDPPKKIGMFTAEQVDADINKVVNETIKELTIKHKDELEKRKTEYKKLTAAKEELLNDLRNQNKSLIEGLCKIKEDSDPEVLNKLTTLLLEITEKASSNMTTKSDRPQMETVFIDPLENSAGEGLEPHIDVEDVSITQKENIQDKVSKLKNLLGGLKTNQGGGV